jgi:hypothetical protein
MVAMPASNSGCDLGVVSYFPVGGEAPIMGASPPAGPPKITLELTSERFPEIQSIKGNTSKQKFNQ